MGIPKIDLCDAHLDLMNKRSMGKFIYRRMALFISSLWFYISNSIIFLFRFTTTHVFRVMLADNSRKDCFDISAMKGSMSMVPVVAEVEEMDYDVMTMKDSNSLVRVDEVTEVEKMNYDFFHEEETPTFSFKFQNQFSNDATRRVGEHINHVSDENKVSTTTGISRYRFSTEKDLSGFVEEPNVMTLCLRESYADFKEDNEFDEEKLDTELTKGFLSAKKFQQPNTSRKYSKSEGSRDLILFENMLSEEELALISETKSLDFMTIGVKQSYIDTKEDGEFDEEKLDSKFTTGFLSANDFEQSNSPGEFIKLGQMTNLTILENKLLEVESPRFSKTYSFGEKEAEEGIRFLSEDFSGFDSDSDSSSDGYSVKDLVIDFDSDGFLSEDDFGGYECESDTSKTSIPSNRYKDEPLIDIEKSDHQQDFVENLDTNSDGHIDDEPPRQEENLQKSRETRLPFLSAVQLEFTDSSDDQLSSFRTDSTRLSSSDDVFSVTDFAIQESKSEDMDGEVTQRTSRTQYSEINQLRYLQNSDTGLDASAPANRLEQIDSNELACEPEEPKAKRKAPEKELQKHADTHLEELGSEDMYELESLWEHQDLIEQLKMELKKVRAGGLPTILEESESPKSIDDLKSWKIDDDFLHENPMDELHKFYKSYKERMRRFDILNYQKMYAIGFLQLKDPLQSLGSRKTLVPTVMSHISQNFWSFCFGKFTSDPSAKFLKELRSDLETVYIGQTCLSWEFLRWQYEKARGLPESDPYRIHQYNEVAGEFQKFQVITQRFLENESFQGPRLPIFVKNRCVLRNLLQVPVIKEDCLNDKTEGQQEGGYAISSEMLEKIMEESISIFWEFVKADKNEAPTILRGLIGVQAELEDPSDYKLMVNAQAILQKKEKKLKDIQRIGNCLVKKFKKPQEDRSNQDLFFSQIDLKLVSMVLKMSRITTEQLVWCHKKLNQIKFSERKIQRESSFILFPC